MRRVANESKVLIEDIVYRVMKHEEDHKIMFAKHSGVYYLRANSKHYSSILAALEESRKNGETIKLKADPTSLDIEELVLTAK